MDRSSVVNKEEEETERSQAHVCSAQVGSQYDMRPLVGGSVQFAPVMQER
jgi:hypothetical protein